MNAVVKTEPTEAGAMISLIARAASDPNVDIDKMERLLEMQERIVARQSESDFNAAMSACQAEMGRISADANNPQTRSKYASYGKLDSVLRPIYTRHGLALSFDEAESPKPEHVRVLCHVTHRGGHKRTYQKDMPADGKGAKGGDVMTKTHAVGAAMSYGMRYLLKGIFNVAIGEEDRDGNDPAAPPTLTEDQVANIDALITEIGIDRAKLLKWAKVENVREILSRNYSTVVRELEARRKR